VADGVVGREVELAALDRFVERAAIGISGLVLEGEAGIGKSTIWDAAVDAARDAGFRVLRSRPARSEQGLTLGGLTDLLGELDARDLAALPEPQRVGLEVALLRATPSDSSPAPDQRTLSVAVAGLLRLLADAGPVLVALDDAQWLDGSSAAIVAYSVRRLADRPVGLLVSVRTGRDGGSAPDLTGAVDPARTQRIVLGPLPLASLHRLFEARLGRSFHRLELLRIGLSSRQIADRAFLAPKTVGNVLGRVYEKLGIHSRAELGALMAGEVAGAMADGGDGRATDPPH
jgi:hypothetical protein